MNYFFEGIALGAATGISCFIFCLPVFLGASINGRNGMILNFSFFTLGRFIAYMTAGITVSFLGQKLLHVPFFDPAVKALTGILLLYWGIKELIRNNENHKENKMCPVKNKHSLNPLSAGILTGISPCPPFLAGIGVALSGGSAVSGMVFFSGFFVSTTLLLSPFLPFGLIKYKDELKTISQFISIIAGFAFLIYGIIKFL